MYPRSLQLTNENQSDLAKNITTEMRKRYEAIDSKQHKFVDNPNNPNFPAANEADLLNFLQGLPQGVINTGVEKVTGFVDGALAEYVLQKGLGIRPEQLKIGVKLDVELNKNWAKFPNFSYNTGLSFTLDKRFQFTVYAQFEEGKYKGAFLMFTIK